MGGLQIDYASKRASGLPAGGFMRLIGAAIVCLITLILTMPLFVPDPQGVKWVILVGLPATSIVLGFIARRNMGDGARHRRGANITVLLLLLLAVAFVCSLILKCVSDAQARRHSSALRIKCTSNLRHIGLAMLMYANDNNGLFPPTLDALMTIPYPNIQLTPDVFICPDGSDTPATGKSPQEVARHFRVEPHHLSYVYRGAGFTNTVPADQILAYEHPTSHHHHDEGINVLFGDGHVAFLATKDAANQMARSAARYGTPGHE